MRELEANSEHLEISWGCLADFLEFSLVGGVGGGKPMGGIGRGKGERAGSWKGLRLAVPASGRLKAPWIFEHLFDDGSLDWWNGWPGRLVHWSCVACACAFMFFVCLFRLLMDKGPPKPL